MNVLAGLVQPDAGEIELDGRPLTFRTPHDAIAHGIAMVHQHFKLISSFTVEENLALEWAHGVLDFARLRRRLDEITGRLGIELDPRSRVGDLPIGKQQQVEILKALWRTPRVLILDEPTAVLAPEEREGLMQLVRQMKLSGTAVLLISHKLEDITACCERVVVMRRGRVVESGPVAGRSANDLLNAVVGGALPSVIHEHARAGEPVLSVAGLQVRRSNGTLAVDGATFDVRAGEVVALCGVEGNGQTELFHTLAGMTVPDAGQLRYRLGTVTLDAPQSPADLRRHGVAHVPEDRLRHAVIPGMPLAANWLLTRLAEPALVTRGLIRWRGVRREVEDGVRTYDVRSPGLTALVQQLSGGNQQKLVLARELSSAPTLVLAAHPSRGLDVRTVSFVQRKLLEARDRGAGVLVLSSDLAEVWPCADRIMVMVEGRLRGPVPLAQTSEREIGHWMSVRAN